MRHSALAALLVSAKHVRHLFCAIRPGPQSQPGQANPSPALSPFSLRPARLAKPRVRFLTSTII
jgi:hypothetical protein